MSDKKQEKIKWETVEVITMGCTYSSKKKKKKNCGPYSYKKKWETIRPVLHYSYHPSKKCVLSIIITKKGPKRGRKAIIEKNVPHDGTPIKHGLLHLWWRRDCREKSQSLVEHPQLEGQMPNVRYIWHLGPKCAQQLEG